MQFPKPYCKALSLDQLSRWQPMASQCCLLLTHPLKNHTPAAWQGSLHFTSGREKQGSGVRASPALSIALIPCQLPLLPPEESRQPAIPLPHAHEVWAAGLQNCPGKSFVWQVAGERGMEAEPGRAQRAAEPEVTLHQPELKHRASDF